MGKIFFVCFLCSAIGAYGQTTTTFYADLDKSPGDSLNVTVDIIPDFFLLGTLSRNTGCSSSTGSTEDVDRYDPYERPAVGYLCSYIKDNYGIRPDTITELSGYGKIVSAQLTKRLQQYYSRDGSLIDTLFKTRAQLCSFILGNYYRYGEKLDKNIYKMKIVNSPKSVLLQPILAELQCRGIIVEHTYDTLVSDVFYFKASPGLMKYFNTLGAPKRLYDQSYCDQRYNDEPDRKERKAKYEKEKIAEAKDLYRGILNKI